MVTKVGLRDGSVDRLRGCSFASDDKELETQRARESFSVSFSLCDVGNEDWANFCDDGVIEE